VSLRLSALVLLLAGCPSARTPTTTAVGSGSQPVRQPARPPDTAAPTDAPTARDLEGQMPTLDARILATLDLPDPSAGADLARDLARDWEREAGNDPDRDEIIQVLVSDLDQAAQQVPRDSRLGLLRARLTEREVRRLNVQIFDMAKRVHAGDMPAQAAAPIAQDMLERVAELRQTTESDVPPAYRADILRQLQETFLEATWIVSGGEGATSSRLDRHISDQDASDGPAPPDVSP